MLKPEKKLVVKEKHIVQNIYGVLTVAYELGTYGSHIEANMAAPMQFLNWNHKVSHRSNLCSRCRGFCIQKTKSCVDFFAYLPLQHSNHIWGLHNALLCCIYFILHCILLQNNHYNEAQYNGQQAVLFLSIYIPLLTSEEPLAMICRCEGPFSNVQHTLCALRLGLVVSRPSSMYGESSDKAGTRDLIW